MMTDKLNIEKELASVYVQAYRLHINEREVSKEKLVTAIKYLNTLSGGIAAYRKSESLIHAVEHIDSMPDSRLDDFGLPQDYAKEDLRYLMVEEEGYLCEDFDRVVEKFHKSRGFLPSPGEFVEFHNDLKVYLEQKVADTEKKMKETQQKMEETRQEMNETTQALERSQREQEKTVQDVVESRRKLLVLRQDVHDMEQALEQKDRMIQLERQQLKRERQLLQQERQMMRNQEQTPKAEIYKQLHEIEKENRRLCMQRLCKICMEREVQVVFIPCGHLVSCQQCAQCLTEEKCPMCRENIEGKVRVFFN